MIIDEELYNSRNNILSKDQITLLNKELIPYLQQCVQSSYDGNRYSWTLFAKAFVQLGVDKDLRLIRDAFIHYTFDEYIHNKSIQRKSTNAIVNVEVANYVICKVIPPDPQFITSLQLYMKTNVSDFLRNIGNDLNQFLLWLDYRTLGGEFERKMKKRDLDSLKSNIISLGDVHYTHLLLRATMAYKSIVTRTQDICNRLGIESGMDEKKRLEERHSRIIRKKQETIKELNQSIFNNPFISFERDRVSKNV